MSQRRVRQAFPARTLAGQAVEIPVGTLLTRCDLQRGTGCVDFWVDSPHGPEHYLAALDALVPATVSAPTETLPPRAFLSRKRHTFDG